LELARAVFFFEHALPFFSISELHFRTSFLGVLWFSVPLAIHSVFLCSSPPGLLLTPCTKADADELFAGFYIKADADELFAGFYMSTLRFLRATQAVSSFFRKCYEF
jgi:hypothetical protein